MTPGQPALQSLQARARDDLARIAHPRMPWLQPRTAPDGTAALDVLVIGAGQSGLATAIGLLRAQVTNILVIDQAPAGQEGPWLTYARMRTLRSPKDYTGPDLDLPSLGYQSWHEAAYGPAHWQQLDQILRQDWAAYLAWVRDTVGVPVQNETRLTHLAPADGLIAATLIHDGRTTIRHARKIVLATGQDGAGTWSMPGFVQSLPTHLRAHTADPIDFPALRGRRVAVLGAGASALDNAAMALEAGAATVDLFCRRPQPQLVQPYRWLTFHGFLQHLSDLDDEWRWRFMARILGMREGFPQPTWDRCAAHPNFHLHTGAPWTGATTHGDTVQIQTPKGPHEADFLICGTGVDMDFARRPELAAIAADIATWSDRYTPPADERDDRLARFPYLAPDYALLPRTPSQAGWIQDIHLFTIAATMSFGPSASSINAMTTAVPKLVRGLTRALFKADLPHHWQTLQAYDTPQSVL